MPPLERITRNPEVMAGKPCIRGVPLWESSHPATRVSENTRQHHSSARRGSLPL